MSHHHHVGWNIVIFTLLLNMEDEVMRKEKE
jgi:hypothetical protein